MACLLFDIGIKKIIFEFCFESPMEIMVTEWINTEWEGEELTGTSSSIKGFSISNTFECSYKTDS